MSFSDLTQQLAVAAQLQRSLQGGRLAHAYLFTGPRGSGKETVAAALAKALNCTETEHDSCDRCDSCRRVDEGVHPDVYWVRPEKKSRRIGVEQIRALEKAVNLKPSMARVKVGIIVDADCLSEEASNAFLKTLEEPPAQTVIVLLSAEPQRLLPTILSRCLKLSFGPTAPRAPSPHQEKLLPLLAQLATPGQSKIAAAYRLLTGVTALLQEIRKPIAERLEAEADLDRYEGLEPDARERLEAQLAARIKGEYRAARGLVLEELYSWFADLLLCVQGADEQLLEHRDMIGGLRRAAAGLNYERANANLEAIEQARESLSRNISEVFALEISFLKLNVSA